MGEASISNEKVVSGADFRPHARLLTERTRPSSIIAAMGSHKRLRVDFPADMPADQYLTFVVDALPDEVLAFGRVIGFEIRYGPDHKVRFTRDATPIPEPSA